MSLLETFQLSLRNIWGSKMRPFLTMLGIIIGVCAVIVIVFVEVKTHIRKSTRASRLWCVDRRKKNILLRACTNWILKNKWHGNFRFDVIPP